MERVALSRLRSCLEGARSESLEGFYQSGSSGVQFSHSRFDTRNDSLSKETMASRIPGQVGIFANWLA